jgi:hypothetical protein
MRIPSQFNDESLYRRRPNQRDSGDTTRRLIRLTLGLVLVVVVMRQAARPELYQAFFGTPPGQGNPIAGTVPVAPIAAIERLDAAEVDPVDQAIARSLTHILLPSDRQQWMVTLSRWKTGRNIDLVPSTIDSIRSELSATPSGQFGHQRRAIWQETLDSLQQISASGEPTSPTETQLVVLSAWLSAMDESAAADVVDGSTWRSGDFDLFFRYLDEASQVSDQNVATTGVVPLLQQPDVYRTQRVRVVGTVARSERVTAPQNPFGITSYWQLWLRPSDGADRPLLAIVREVPSVVSSVGPDATETEGPPVAMVGRYLKRLAYRSQKGADLAPVVVGRLLSRPAPVEPVAMVPETDDSQRMLWVVLLATLVGFSVAAIAMWRTGVTARRSRQLRAAHRQPPDPILKQLGERAEESE